MRLGDLTMLQSGNVGAESAAPGMDTPYRAGHEELSQIEIPVSCRAASYGADPHYLGSEQGS